MPANKNAALPAGSGQAHTSGAGAVLERWQPGVYESKCAKTTVNKGQFGRVANKKILLRADFTLKFSAGVIMV